MHAASEAVQRGQLVKQVQQIHQAQLVERVQLVKQIQRERVTVKDDSTPAGTTASKPITIIFLLGSS